MTRYTTTAIAALLATTSLATAGGVERTGFTTGILFEEGNYLEVGYTFASPDVSGQANAPYPGTPVSGDMAESYGYAQVSYHHEITDQFSISVVADQPIGAAVAYSAPHFSVGGYPFGLSTAELNSNQLSIVGRYEFTDNISVYAGLRAAEVDGTIFVSTPSFSYSHQAESDIGYGYMVGAAYERPDIALRVALTYFSEIDLSLTGVQGVAAPSTVPPAGVIPANYEISLPDSILLEVQSGVAPDTLAFGSIRWVDWSEFDITPGAYPTPSGAVVSYENDTTTYTLGVARRLNEDLVLLGSVNYEAQNGGFASNLGPTDGRFGVGIGARYTMGQVELSGGVNYTWIGDADTSLGAPLTSSFTDNSAVGVGVRVGYRF